LPKEEDKFKRKLGGNNRRKLNTSERDLDRQTEFQMQDVKDTAAHPTEWYMVAVSDNYEESAAKQILSISGTEQAGGASLNVWVPRVPPAGYVVSESDAVERTDMQLMQGRAQSGGRAVALDSKP
jgi:hypothetical protein